MTEYTFPWPPSSLSPNARIHFHALAKAKKAYKEQCYWLSKVNVPVLGEGNIPISITFHAPDKRHRDDDNAIASFKAGRDGIASAWGLDDVRFRPVTYNWLDPVKGGKVVVRVL